MSEKENPSFGKHEAEATHCCATSSAYYGEISFARTSAGILINGETTGWKLLYHIQHVMKHFSWHQAWRVWKARAGQQHGNFWEPVSWHSLVQSVHLVNAIALILLSDKTTAASP